MGDNGLFTAFILIAVMYSVKLEILEKKLKSEKIASEMPIPQPGKIVFNNMRYRSSETVHRLGYFQSSVSVQIMFK